MSGKPRATRWLPRAKEVSTPPDAEGAKDGGLDRLGWQPEEAAEKHKLVSLAAPAGRGGSYGPLRAALEAGLRHLYRGGWPGYCWSLTPFADTVDVIHVTLPILKDAVSPLTIGFASDLHVGPTTSTKTLTSALHHLEAAQLDVLILGGDYVFLDATESIAEQLSKWVALVPAKTKVAVLGNHDLWADHELISAALADGGARVLVNESMILPSPHDAIAVIGLDDPKTGHPDIEAACAGLDDSDIEIVVCHSTDVIDDAARRGASLLLAGHTHGGQIALPGSIPIIVPGRLGRRYPAGHFSVDGLDLFVSRGVGCVELPIRAFARPDVFVITLSPHSTTPLQAQAE